MTGKTIPELLELTSVSDNDQIIIRDVSETGPTKTRYVRASILGNYYTAYLSTVSSQAIAAAQQAAAAAQLAAQTITTVTNAATAAGNSATAAANSATSASTSASTATTQATNASNSATAASNSATAAGTSATNANNSAGAAAGSASAAAGSASAAGTSATNASNSATSAAGSATTAGTAATNAGNSATAAAGSASAASTSASNASTSASNAATSETNSAASATALTGTSTTSLTIGTGSKVFTTQSGKSFNVSTYLFAVDNADTTRWMFGQVTAYSGTSLTISVTTTNGSGTFGAWNLYGRAGPPGQPPPGTGDFVGPASSTTDYIVTFGDGTGKLGKNSGKIIPTGAVVGTTDTQTLTNKTLGFGTGSSQAIAATSANTGFLNDFRVANSGTGTTSGTASRYTLDLSTVSNGYGLFQLTGGATPAATLQSGSGITGGLTISALAGPLAFQNGGGTQSLPTATDTLVGRATTDTLSNKTLDNTNAATLKGTSFTLQDPTDATKQARFIMSGIATATTRSYTLPDVSDTIVTATTIASTAHAFTAKTTPVAADEVMVMDSAASFAGKRSTFTNIIAAFKSTAAAIWAGTSDVLFVTAKNIADSHAWLALTSGATPGWDTSQGYNARIVLGTNATFAAPTNLIDGRTYSLLIVQDATGSRTGAFNSIWDFGGAGAPTLSTAANARDLVVGIYDATTSKLISNFRKGT